MNICYWTLPWSKYSSHAQILCIRFAFRGICKSV